MYKIIIADDEPIVLESLKTFLWSDYQCHVAGFAENGITALHMMETEKADILISDIRMPKMNGLELSKAVKELAPETEIILLTGYAEFEYAKQAMSLGIRQYLLKPFRFEDIETALLGCIHSLNNQESRRRQQAYIQEKLKIISPLLTEQIYQDLLEGRIGDYSEKVAACNIKEALYVVISTQSDFPGSSLDIALYAQIKELLNGMEPEVYLAQGIDIISCILCFNVKHSHEFCEDAALHLCEMLQKTTLQKLGFHISFGISLPSSDIFMLHQLKKQSVQALNCRSSLGGNSLMMYSDIQKTQTHDIFNLTMYEKKIQKCIVQNQKKELNQICEQLLQELMSSAHGDFAYMKKTLINLVVMTYRFAESYVTSTGNEYDAIEHLFRCESMETLSKEAFSLLDSLIQTESGSFSDGIAERITDYMEQNLELNISLDMLSQTMNYSSAYLSRLIKKNTGQSFSELLLDLRLKKAMEMLRITDMKINDIAAKVGYNDVSYFISIFKKRTGVTPKEWRSLSKLGEL